MAYYRRFQALLGTLAPRRAEEGPLLLRGFQALLGTLAPRFPRRLRSYEADVSSPSRNSRTPERRKEGVQGGSKFQALLGTLAPLTPTC